MKLLFALIGIVVLFHNGFAQNLYDAEQLTEIRLEFEVDDWDDSLDLYYANDEGERLVAICYINGDFYNQVGVRFRGGDSYDPDGLKNGLNISLDYITDQECQGYTTLKLSNNKKDPSYVREVLGYEIARKYMDAPLAGFTQVFINDNYYGLFSNVEVVNDAYHQRRLYCDRDNIRFKCNPPSDISSGATLAYLGEDSITYYDHYELESQEGWGDLVDFIFTLNFDISELPEHLDIDRTLWMLAFNNVVVNLSSYTGFSQENYYLLKDNNNRFLPIIWDLDETFGGNRKITDVPATLEELIEMDLFLRVSDGTHPLILRLLSHASYRKKYIAHAKTILEENFLNDWYLDRALALQTIINESVLNESDPFFSESDFSENINHTIFHPDGDIVGLTELMEGRITYLTSLPEWSFDAPIISTVNTLPAQPLAYSSVIINAVITDASSVTLKYRSDYQDQFSEIQMFDDGLHDDGAAGDFVYGASIETTAKDIQFYIYAENENAGKFSPVRAAHEFYHIALAGEVVINEIMPQNDLSVVDEEGKFEDWVELYNRTNENKDIGGYYLSDSPSENPLKWRIPEGTIIPANEYLTVWMDEDTLDEGLHANFKLSANGESISFSSPEGYELSRVKYPEMPSSTTYGRYPNGTGPFIRMFPTFGAENRFSPLSVRSKGTEHLEVKLYPNPATTQFTLELTDENWEDYLVFNVHGAIIAQGSFSKQKTIDVSDWKAGLYVVYLLNRGSYQKLVVH
ncbi:CotH kinase family protein [Crocinitomix algicola]|uniref:CotH kinase family protein n=1 Tax=Crocinitomix algicola TaxID=1740263 RepID=UPI0008724116|nr:CotH kinase family protein [Crocinitomix algicola]